MIYLELKQPLIQQGTNTSQENAHRHMYPSERTRFCEFAPYQTAEGFRLRHPRHVTQLPWSHR